jgi:CO/xanthine dehydrogenase Mo-binding subunit
VPSPCSPTRGASIGADDLHIFTNGVHGAHVEVDTDTGFVKLRKHWVVEDCGRDQFAAG